MRSYQARWPRCRMTLALAVVALTTSGCENANEPQARAFLLGQWGSATANFIAIRAGAELLLGCAVIIIDEPVALQPDGTFSAPGRLNPSGPAIHGELPRVSVTGSISGALATVVVPGSDLLTPGTYVLEAGVSPQGEPPMCPL
jgi:hypothetical protein